MTSIGLMILASGFLLMTVASIPEISRRTRGMFHGWFHGRSRRTDHSTGRGTPLSWFADLESRVEEHLRLDCGSIVIGLRCHSSRGED